MATSNTLKLLFCHNVSAHGCVPQTLPLDISGVKPHKKIEKILKAYSRAGAIIPEEQISSLQLGRCFCSTHSSQSRSSITFGGSNTSESMGLRDGDRVFVRRKDSVQEDQGKERLKEVPKVGE